MIATLLQLAGLVGVTVAGVLQFGVPGAVAGVSAAALYVGVAIDREAAAVRAREFEVELERSRASR